MRPPNPARAPYRSPPGAAQLSRGPLCLDRHPRTGWIRGRREWGLILLESSKVSFAKSRLLTSTVLGASFASIEAGVLASSKLAVGERWPQPSDYPAAVFKLLTLTCPSIIDGIENSAQKR